MKKISLSFLALAVFLWAGQAMATPVVDGNFSTTEWAGYYTNDDGVGTGGFVDPGYGGQAYDVEYTGLYFDSNRLYFGLQTGFDLVNGTTYPDGSLRYGPGDFALDVNNDGTFDYAIDYSIIDYDDDGNIDDVTYTLYDVITWTPTAIYPAVFEMGEGSLTATWTQENAFSSDVFSNNHDGGTSYVLEGSLAWNTNEWGSLGPKVTLQWTMGCGNDVGLVTSTAAPVPEPATMLLFGTGLVGMAVIGRKRKKVVK